MEESRTPRASRPNMPGYGIKEDLSGLLPWDWAVQRLTDAHTYWISTTRPDGRPHAAPIWAVWLDGRLLFSTGETSRKARNFAANPYAVISVEQNLDSVILEGTVEPLADADLRARFAAAYSAKYGMDMSAFAEPIFTVSPRVVFGFSENGDFEESSTRWVF